MKNQIMKGLALVFILFAVSAPLQLIDTPIFPEGVAYAWYASDYLLTSPADGYESSYADAAVDSSGNIHVVWQDKRSGNWDIYYRMISAGGIPGEEIRVDDANDSADPPINSRAPKIAVDPDNRAHIVWEDDRNTNQEWNIYYERIDNPHGDNINNEKVTDHDRDQTSPDVAADADGRAWVVWVTETDQGDKDIRFKKVVDNDAKSTYKVTNTNPGDESCPTIAVDSSNNLHVAYTAWRSSSYRVYYAYKDSGHLNSNFDNETLISGSGNPVYPDISARSNMVSYLVWKEGTSEIKYTRINNGTPGSTITASSGSPKGRPSISIGSDGHAHIIFRDYKPGRDGIYNSGIFYSRLDASDTIVAADYEITEDPAMADSYGCAVVVQPGIPTDSVNVIWTDSRLGINEIFYQKGSGTLPPTSTVTVEEEVYYWGDYNSTWLDDPIHGSANDPELGAAGIENVKILIEKEDSPKYWDGWNWTNTETWLYTTDTGDRWQYDGPDWSAGPKAFFEDSIGQLITVYSKARDTDGNDQGQPYGEDSFMFLRITYTISGNVNLNGETNHSGVTVKVEGTALEAQTDTNGDYTIYNVPEGMVTLSASKEGWTLSPTFANPFQLTANAAGKNFNGTRTTYTISGTVLGGFAGIEVSASGDGGQYETATTRSDGTYTISGPSLTSGNYWVSAYEDGYSIVEYGTWTNPVAVSSNVAGIDFIAYTIMYTLTGRVTEQDGTTGIAGVTILRDDSEIATTGSDGRFSVENHPGGTFTFRAQKTGYSFARNGFGNPCTLQPGFGVWTPAINFKATATPPPTFNISGSLTGLPPDQDEGITVSISGGLPDTQTDSSGNYTFADVEAGDYIITVPATVGDYNADDPSVNVTVASSDIENIDFNYSPAVVTTPHIDEVSPDTGPGDISVTLLGSNFTYSSVGNSLIIAGNDYTDTVTQWEDKQIIFTIPALSGPPTKQIYVLVNGESSNTDKTYTFTADPNDNIPSIERIVPSYGPVGISVTLYGNNFGANNGLGEVKIGSYDGIVTQWEDDMIVFTVPQSFASTGNRKVRVRRYVAPDYFESNSVWLDVTDINPNSDIPSIKTITPSSGPAGQLVTLGGQNFGTSGTLRFGGNDISWQSRTDNIITFLVPQWASAGTVYEVQVTANGKESNTVRFTVSSSPTQTIQLDSISPERGTAGITATLFGPDFGSVQGTVYFGSFTCTIHMWEEKQITFTVPPGATIEMIYDVYVEVGTDFSNSVTFEVTSIPVNPPSINTIDPSAGPVGTVVTLEGINFGVPGELYFDGNVIAHDSWSGTSITFTVPETSLGAKLVRVMSGGNFSNSVEFTVTRPDLDSENTVFNYPNPFDPTKNESTVFEFELEDLPKEVTAYVYDLSGKLVWQETTAISANPGQITWDGRDMKGDTVATGVYLALVMNMDDEVMIGRCKPFVVKTREDS